MPDSFDPYHRLLGIRCGCKAPDHYRLLGLEPFEDNPDVIATAADRQMVHLRNYQQGRYTAYTERLLNEVAGARVCLLDPTSKARYDSALRPVAPGLRDERGNDGASQQGHSQIEQPSRGGKPGEATEPDNSNDEPPNQHRPAWSRGANEQGVGLANEVRDTAHSDPALQPDPTPHPLPRPGQSSLDTIPDTSTTPLELSDWEAIWQRIKTLPRNGVQGAFVGLRMFDRGLARLVGEDNAILHGFLRIVAAVTGAVLVVLVAVGGVVAFVLLGTFNGFLAGTDSRKPPDSTPAEIASRELEQLSEPIDDRVEPESLPTGTVEEEQPVGDAVRAPTVEMIEWPVNLIPLPPVPDVPSFDNKSPVEPVQPSSNAEGNMEPFPERPKSPPEPPADIVSPDPIQVTKKPVPDRAEQQRLRRTLDETFDTAALREPEEELGLANKLAVLAEKAENATERFVLLRRASELASDGGHVVRMLELVNRIAEEFEVDRLLAQAVMLDAFAKMAIGEQQISALVDASATVIDEALDAERFDLAESVATSVYRACQPSAGRPFRVDALARRREVDELRGRWNEVQTARTALESNPDDDAAHTIVAQWYYFIRDDWAQALPHFAKSSETQIKGLAERELDSPPENAAAQVQLADAWWDMAETSAPHSRPFWLARAAYWYKQALPELTSPIMKAKVSQRLDEFLEPKPPPSRRADGMLAHEGHVHPESKHAEDLPPPHDLVLVTPQDRVELAVTYYLPIKPGENVVPVVLLHQFKGSRRDYVELALLLQRSGHAVVVPDLRGHGRSTSIIGANQRVDADRLRPADLQRMVIDDMEAVNRFLCERNNAGQLNMNRMCIVGAEMGASVALLCAARDWSIPDYGPLQLGRFVKAVVLISPEWSFKGLTMQNAIRHPAVRSEVSMLIAAGGRRPTSAREANRIHDMIKPHRPDPPPNRVAEETCLFYTELDTTLQGTDILGQGLKLEQFIAQFVNLHLVKAPKAARFEWAERRPPHGFGNGASDTAEGMMDDRMLLEGEGGGPRRRPRRREQP